ncbi:hypothetical protein [Bailinhaonella thermotolerans]|uniref:hypothetical protein n=1 Tax=Bailinhaonella thermotolerans TaxID=1070861 RepID=UPI000E757240|nr:hypothetical protein [Bailinhaonella thermotolerans]
MRRYRFGLIAGPLAILYLAASLLAAASAIATGEDGPFLRLAEPGSRPDGLGRRLPVLLAAVAVQAWAIWHLARGRLAGPAPAASRLARWARVLLYAMAADHLIAFAMPYDPPAWTEVVSAGLRLAVVTVVARLLTGASRRARTAALVAGTLDAAAVALLALARQYGSGDLAEYAWLSAMTALPALAWAALTLRAQSRDGRFAGLTVRAGYAGMLVPAAVLVAAFLVLLTYSAVDASSQAGAPVGVAAEAAGALAVLAAAWAAMSAHDLGNPPPPEEGPERPPFRWRPLPAVAVALPVLPALPLLAAGDEGFWRAAEAAVGLALLAAPVAAAVLCRTRRLVLGATGALLAVAALAVVAAAAGHREPSEGPLRGRLVAAGLLEPSAGAQPYLFGVSPPLLALACALSALILWLTYGGSPRWTRVVPRAGGVAAALALVAVLVTALVPTGARVPGGGDPGPRSTRVAEPTHEDPEISGEDGADPGETTGPGRNERGPEAAITREGECGSSDPDFESEPLPKGEPGFVCGARAAIPSALNMPDKDLVAYGRRLCGVYERDDRAEIARLRAKDGVDVTRLREPLAEICPGIAAEIKAARDRQDREFQAMEEADRRACAAFRHRPLITPLRAVRHREPIVSEFALMGAVEPGAVTDEDDPGEDLIDLSGKHPVAASRPGMLVINFESDATTCVITETYDRRPPVETRGWDEVVEIAYRSTDGKAVLQNPLGELEDGWTLPNLAPRGPGHYRIRVHLGRQPAKDGGAAKLLIMSYPGRAKGTVVHRAAPRR